VKKMSLLVVAGALALSSARPAYSQASPEVAGIKAGVKAGWLWPSGALDDVFGGTYVLGVDVAYRTTLLGIGVDARFSRKQKDITVGDSSFGVTWTNVPISGNAYLNLFVEETNTLYAGGGPTAVYTRIESGLTVPGFEGSVSDGKWTWGWNALLGADSGRFYIEGQFLWVEEGSLDLGGFDLTLGYRF